MAATQSAIAVIGTSPARCLSRSWSGRIANENGFAAKRSRFGMSHRLLRDVTRGAHNQARMRQRHLLPPAESRAGS